MVLRTTHVTHLCLPVALVVYIIGKILSRNNYSVRMGFIWGGKQQRLSQEKDLKPNQTPPKHVVVGQKTIYLFSHAITKHRHSHEYTDFILNLSEKILHRITQFSNYKTHRDTVKKHSILFSLCAIASMAVNPVTVWTRDNYKCCLHIAAAHLLLKRWCWEVYGARCEKGDLCPERGRRGKRSIWLAFSPERDHGIASGQPLGAAAVSADRALPHVAT